MRAGRGGGRRGEPVGASASLCVSPWCSVTNVDDGITSADGCGRSRVGQRQSVSGHEGWCGVCDIRKTFQRCGVIGVSVAAGGDEDATGCTNPHGLAIDHCTGTDDASFLLPQLNDRSGEVRANTTV